MGFLAPLKPYIAQLMTLNTRLLSFPFFRFICSLISKHPTVDNLSFESPLAAKLRSRHLALLAELVDFLLGNLKVIRNLVNCEPFVGHLSFIPTAAAVCFKIKYFGLPVFAR